MPLPVLHVSYALSAYAPCGELVCIECMSGGTVYEDTYAVVCGLLCVRCVAAGMGCVGCKLGAAGVCAGRWAAILGATVPPARELHCQVVCH